MRLVKDEAIRKDVLAITLRVEQARDLLRDAAEHMRAAAHEDDPQHAAALLTLGGELADYAEAILQHVAEWPERRQEPKAVEQAEQPKQPRIELQWREGFADGVREAQYGKYKAEAIFVYTGKWHLQIFIGDDYMASFSRHDNFDSLNRLANAWINHHIKYYSTSEVST
jgi:Cft2 family RNA processing exonuclease